jgi:hypothetical protein
MRKKVTVDGDGWRKLVVLIEENDSPAPSREGWEEIKSAVQNLHPRSRGRPELHPSLFGNPDKDEVECEKQKIITSTGRVRGALTKAVDRVARQKGISLDAMRARIRKK